MLSHLQVNYPEGESIYAGTKTDAENVVIGVGTIATALGTP